MGGARAWGPKGRLECRQRADGKLPPTAQRETFQNMEGLFFFVRGPLPQVSETQSGLIHDLAQKIFENFFQIGVDRFPKWVYNTIRR